jgi:TATA-box binding protein (TBP) (component of TFIID and TFIIIB)
MIGLSKNSSLKIAIKKFKPFINLDNLPSDLHISTVTMTGMFDTTFNIPNIGAYLDLSPDGVVSVKYGSGTNIIRSLIPKKEQTKKKKKVKRVFYNQASVEVLSKLFKNKINIKIFKNGSIQMTGCKCIENCLEVIDTLCVQLKKVKAILDPEDMKTIIMKPFAANTSCLDVTQVKNLTVRMINSNLKIGFKVDRDKLYRILIQQGVDCIFEPCAHAGVNIKYNYKGTDKISIFIFESGSVIITGAKSRDQLICAYNFVTQKLFENYHRVTQSGVTIDQILNSPDIQKMISSAKALSLREAN